MKIIQLTDTHLMPPGAVVNGVDPERQLRLAVDDILARHGDTNLMVITGDLCNHGDPEAYALLREILAPVPFEVRLLIGNHDRRPEFRDAFPEHPVDGQGFVQSFKDTGHGRLLFLDTHEAGMIGGLYGPDRMAFLDDALAGAGDVPVTVFIHHPPFDSGIGHFDKIGLHDDGALMQRLGAHPGGVRHIIFGHIHIPMAGTAANGIAYSSGQATGHRFITDLADPCPWWTGGNPTYRILLLDEQGLRAYTAETSQVATSRAALCEGP